MKTIDEACKEPGVSKSMTGGLCLHFSPLPNWYTCFSEFNCPICDSVVSWKWEGEIPGFTNSETVKHLKPVFTGAELKGHGHRWFTVVCDKCKTVLNADNFD